MQEAVNAVMDGGLIPGSHPDARLVELSTPYLTDLSKLNQLLQLAKKHGYRAMKLPPGRALAAVDIRRTYKLWSAQPEHAFEDFELTKIRAIKRAGITSTHRINGVSSDTASRSPVLVPWAIYPFSAEDCAALICDLLSFEITISVDMLVELLESKNLKVTLMPLDGQEQDASTVLLKASLEDKTLSIHAGSLNLLFYELLQPEVWAKGVLEVIELPNPPKSPNIVFANEHSSWWQ